MGADAEPHVYATAHLANAASLLLPVSNLTNLLAFRASGLGFGRFAALMAGPWIVAITLDYTVVPLRFAPRLAVSRPRAGLDDDGPAPVLALGVLGAVLLGFALASPLGIDVVWPALAGVLVLLGVRLVRGAPAGRELASALRAANPLFLAFVLALGVVVRAVVDHGLADAARRLLPAGTGLLSVIATAVIAAVLANLVNNLPATLMLIPLVAPAGAVPVLAVLIGVNVGPNLTYVGSLATLLWRRVLAGHGRHSDLAEFTRLGALAVPASVVAAAVALWAATTGVRPPEGCPMTTDRDFKNLVHARMNGTGETYTAARAAQLAEHDEAQRFHDRTVRAFLRDGRLVSVPARRRARVVILLELLGLFEPGRDYPEREVNEILRPVHEDVAYLRRELVDYGFLTRSRSVYRVADELPEVRGNVASEVPGDLERRFANASRRPTGH